LKGGTLFSGIGAPEAAAPAIDWRWCAEIDPFACAVLAERFPALRNLGDVTRIEPDAIEPVDLVVFGSPCQSFSVAGNRRGLDDPRGNLAFVALGLIGGIRPRWLFFENVPGLLRSGKGRDFGAFLGALGQLGYGFAYRILDAQYAGVPQRRRRIFVVGYLGDWRPAAAVLFERDGLRRDPLPRRQAGQNVAAAAPTSPSVVAFEKRFVRNGRGAPGAVVPPLKAQSGHTGKGDSAPLVIVMPVTCRPRWLTPCEWERLQGLPDDWTAIDYRGKPAADGPRYRAIGNSMAVPVIGWVLQRIHQVTKGVLR
jgi:DNA (cytosine-5)-methyltransferase 1